MAKAGTVYVDVVTDTSAASAQIKSWGAGLKPVEVEVKVDSTLGDQTKTEVATAQKALDTLNTDKAQAQIRQLQQQGKELVPAPFGGALTATQGFSVSNQKTTFTGSTASATARSLSTTATSASAAAKEIDRAGTSAGRAVAPTARYGTSINSLGRDFGQAAANVAQFAGPLDGLVQGLGNAAAGGIAAGAAAEVAVAGFGSAWTQLKQQTEQGLKPFLPTEGEIQAAFDPTRPQAFGFEVEKIGRILAKQQEVGDTNAWDTIQGWFGFHDDDAGKVKLVEETMASLRVQLDGMATSQARQFLAGLIPVLEKYGLSTAEATDLVAGLNGELDQRDAIDRAKADLTDITKATDGFGFALDSTKGRLAQYAESLGKAFDPIQGAISAQDAVVAGQDRIAKARQKLTDIESGSSDALTSARKQLVEADKDLTKAIEDEATKQKDLLDRLRDAQDKLAQAREEGAAIATGGIAGTAQRPDLSVARGIAAAQRDVAAAQRDLDANRNGSDQLTAAKQRQADAQARVNEEEKKVGPNSEAATQAQKELNDAEAAMPGLLVASESAAAKLGDELDRHPQAIEESINKVKEWQSQGLIAGDVANRWLTAMEQILTTSQGLGINPSGKDVGDNEHSAQRPVVAPPAPPKQKALDGAQGEKIGLFATRGAGDTGLVRPGEARRDNQGRVWKWDGLKWLPQFHDGGLVGVEGGEVHDGEFVFNRFAVAKYGAQNLLAANRSASSSTAGQGGAVGALAPQSSAQLLAKLDQILTVLTASVNSRPNVSGNDITVHEATPQQTYLEIVRGLGDSTYGRAT